MHAIPTAASWYKWLFVYMDNGLEFCILQRWYRKGNGRLTPNSNVVNPPSKNHVMRKTLLTGLAAAALISFSGPAAYSQSPYFQAVTNLNPVLYLPLQETAQPPAIDVETNLGTLGSPANAIYPSVWATKGFTPAATADGDTAVLCQGGGDGSFLTVPTMDRRTAIQSPSFTVEAWIYPTNYNNAVGIVSQSGANPGGLNGTTNAGGFCLSANYIAYLDSANLRGFSFHVYNGRVGSPSNGSLPRYGAEVAVPYNYQLNTWYHLVGVFDGVNVTLYVNGVNMNSVAAATDFLIPMPAGTSFNPDYWDALEIGASRGFHNNRFGGAIDEVAIYTNALTSTQVSTHYSAASGTGYSTTVLGDNPYMYWRMDNPPGSYTIGDPTTFPTAANYGSVTTTTGNGTQPYYGTATKPGVQGPQYPGMQDPNNGNQSLAVQINGTGGANGGSANANVNIGDGATISEAMPIDAGIDSRGLLNFTNFNNYTGFSVSIWFRGNPTEANGGTRFQNMCGHSDNGWRVTLDQNGKVHFKGGSGGTEFTSVRVYNDGNWHQVVATMTSASENLYVDGVLDSTTASSASTENGCVNDVMIGGDPQYLSNGNQNSGGIPAYVLHYGLTGSSAFNNGVPCRDFGGMLAHFAFFTNALSAGQVQSLYSAAGAPPVIMSQPLGSAQSPNFPRVNPAPGFMFEGVISSGATNGLYYQWYFNTVSNVATATPLVNNNKYASVNTSQVTVSNLVDSDSGYYFVIITNNYGAVTSSLAWVVINDEPIITSQTPASNFTLNSGQSQIFSVSVQTDTNVFYQWYTNGVGDPSGTNASYTFGPVTSANNGETFQCIATNIFGSATSTNLTLSVVSGPTPPSSVTSSPFGSQILALNPTAYWPMHESPSTALVQRDIETNYGTLGNLGTAYYGDWQELDQHQIVNNPFVIHSQAGALANDPDPAVQFTSASGFPSGGSYAIIPHDSPTLTLTPPFTLEAWVKPYNDSFGIIFSVGNGNNGGVTNRDASAHDNFGGFDWLWAGTANTFSITMRSGPTSNGFSTAGPTSTEPKTTANYFPGNWYHVVTTYDGTNIAYYINGVQDSLQNSSAASFNPDSWHPLTIGGGRWNGGINNQFAGVIDELAVYTNILSVSDITTHYNDGISGAAGTYKSDVLSKNPLLYYRMDSPTYTPPPRSSWPTLANYGSAAIQGVYKPNAVPGGGPGPNLNGVPFSGLSGNSALLGDGNSVFADAGFDAQFNPGGTSTANRTPFSVGAWVRTYPSDNADRGWQSFLGRSDSGWRLNIDANSSSGTPAGSCNVNFNTGSGGSGDIGNNNRNPNTIVSASKAFINDGKWHYVLGSYDGSNTTVYVDGQIAESAFNTNPVSSSAAWNLYLGSYPNATNAGGGRSLAGSMCEAAYWNGSWLSSNQVQNLYNIAGVPPFILTQPVSGSANEVGAFTNSVSAGGSGPLSYQWYKNGQPMPVGGQTNFTPGFGPTNTTLILNPVSTNDQSLNYFVVITNNYGAVTSSIWSINPVFTFPVFTNDIAFTNLILYAGGHATFSVLALGAQPITYRWYSNNVAVTAATNTTFQLNNVQPANQTNICYCVASNFVGVTTSSIAVIDIISIPAVIPYSLAVMTDNPTGFWPLDETNGGNLTINSGVIAVADDYAGGNNGLYTNCLLGQAGFNSSDTNRTSVQFGSFTFTGSDVYNIPTNVDFTATNGKSSNFSVECWAKGFQQTVDAGIVTKGYGGGGEQFNLDCGSGSGASPHSFRFFFRDASGAVHGVNSTINPNDGLWHHLVGVCNETNGQVILYIDGLPVGTNSFSTGLGALAGTRNMTIGARASNSTTNVNDLQFVGFIQDVSVYNYALSQQQVINHYFAADIPATIVGDAADENACQNGTALLTTTVLATPPVGYQWYDNNTTLPIAGATNSSLLLPNIQTSDSYYMVATNNYGTNQTRTATVTVYSGAPVVLTEPPASAFVPKGNTISIPATVLGTLPMTNQWQMSDTNGLSWTNLADNVRTSGSQQIWLNMTNSQPSILTIGPAKVSDGGDYQLATTNGSGSTASSIDTITVGTLPIGFNGNGIGWTANQGGTYNNPPIAGNVWEGTEAANGSEVRSFFFQFPQYIGAFSASFSYQDIGGGGADGVCFCIQNDARGAAAIGGGGGSLGVSGITPSWELEINIYSGSANGLGYNIFTNGVVGSDIVPTQGTNTISFASGDPINISLFYIGGRMTLTFVDTVTTATVTTNFAANIPTAVNGQTAYIGFTAADGGVNSQQVVTNFQFASLASESLSVSNGTNAVISWNGLITGYTLQQNGNLSTTNWVDVPAADIVTNGLHKVTVPINSVTNLFYRLNSSD